MTTDMIEHPVTSDDNICPTCGQDISMQGMKDRITIVFDKTFKKTCIYVDESADSDTVTKLAINAMGAIINMLRIKYVK